VRSDRERLLDILEAIDRIEKYARLGRRRFKEDELVQAWMIHHIEIIGEAAARISDALQRGHRDVPWREMAAMRNLLVHDYFGIDIERVWVTVERDLPCLSGKLRSILEILPEP